METTSQVIVIIMTVVLGSTLVVIGIMLVFLLKDLRQSVKSVNSILLDVEALTSSVAGGSDLVHETLVTLQQTLHIVRDQIASPLGSIVGLFKLVQGFSKRKGGE